MRTPPRTSPLPSRGRTRGRCDGDRVDLRGGGESREETRRARRAPPSRVEDSVWRHGTAALVLAAVAYTTAGDLDGAYAAGNRALDEAARSDSIGSSSWFVIWFPSMRPFRQDPRFQAFVERLNLLEYWKVYGPPDGCALDAGKIVCH
jgi:hypothetical protein